LQFVEGQLALTAIGYQFLSNVIILNPGQHAGRGTEIHQQPGESFPPVRNPLETIGRGIKRLIDTSILGGLEVKLLLMKLHSGEIWQGFTNT
jgi:hypothetical protein